MLLNALLLVVTVNIATAQSTSPRTNVQQILSTTIPHYRVNALNLLEAAGQIASDFNLPLGIEWQGNPQAKQKIVMEWSNSTVEQILYDTARFDINYQVQITNGVVHIWATNVASHSRNPLNILVPDFSVTGEYSRQAALQLRDKVNSLMIPGGKTQAAACTGSRAVSSDEKLVTLSMKNVKAWQILDAILDKSRSAMWLAVFQDQQPTTGFLKTASPWRKTADLQKLDLDFLPRFHDPATGAYRGDWEIGLFRK